jgi:hypothetical protein
MAMSAAGLRAPVLAAYDFLRDSQRPNGSWPAKVVEGVVEDAGSETNQVAYIAVGVLHELLLHGDVEWARGMWPTVRDALDFVTSYATDRGEIYWWAEADGKPRTEALLTGSSSTYHALRCGLALAERFDSPQPEWELAAGKLGHVLAAHPEAFLNKDRFSMDWYYPVLGGAVRGEAGRARIASRWDDFMVAGLGARCVDDEPWVTGAETCELVIAMETVGLHDRALAVFAEMQHLRDADGSYWTGWQYVVGNHFPAEHSTWTAAAVILAADVLSKTSPASGIFHAGDLPVGIRLDELCGCELPARR